MTLQNRVAPTGEIVTHPARGTLTGNRGILHRPDQTLGTSRWQHPNWVICTLHHPRGTYHGPMPDRAWTALFFLDEAVALAAGHRPCHYCQRARAREFRAAWDAAHGPTGGPVTRMPDLDRALHAARVTRGRQQIVHSADAADLPPGSFIAGQTPILLTESAAHTYSPAGYGPPQPRPSGTVTVLTPAPTIATLRHGYRPDVHPTARDTGKS